MSRNNDLPFERGSTFYAGGTIDSNNLGGVQHEGMEKLVEDIDLGNTTPGAKPSRSGRIIRIRCVRNMSAAPLLPKQVVQLDKTNPGRVVGTVGTTGDAGKPVDEFLPAAGCPQYDLCWIVVNGPAMVKTPMTGALFGGADIAAGDVLTAASSNAGSTATGTTAAIGRVAIIAPNAATDATQTKAAVNLAARLIGCAISAKTTGNTNADILIDVGEFN